MTDFKAEERKIVQEAVEETLRDRIADLETELSSQISQRDLTIRDLRAELNAIATAAETFILGQEVAPGADLTRLVKVIARWRGVPLAIGRNGEGAYVVYSVKTPGK
jgi:hypothetical protein